MAAITLEAQLRTQAQVEFLMQKTRFFEGLRGALNTRQEGVLLRMFREGPKGFTGGLSAANYMSISKASSATATRDLGDLVDKQALRREGERKSTRYYLAIPEILVPRVSIDAEGAIIYALAADD